MKETQKLYQKEANVPSGSVTTEVEQELTVKTEPVVVKQLSPKLMPLMEMNPDTVGWLTIPGTSIDYRVVQAQDNEQFILDIASRSLHPGVVEFTSYNP
jgi:sortase B